MKKINFSKGTTGRLVGAAAGGAASAVWDTYVTPALPASVSAYPDYVKIAAGAVVPMFVKGNQLVNSLCDGLMTCGVQNVVAGLLTSSSTSSNSVSGIFGAPATDAIGRRRRRSFASYRNAIRLAGAEDAAASAVAGVNKKKVVYQG